MATELLANISKDERERANYRSRMMYQMDLDHNMSVARDEAQLKERNKWEGVVAEKDALIAELRAQLGEKDVR